jgi:pSer/pThr/pTyr-binding forkhead associated (FHA) protein
MPDGLLGALKLCLLALLYLFFLRVLRAVWSEIKGPKLRDPKPEKAPKPSRQDRKRPSQLILTAAGAQNGSRFSLDSEMTIGRAAGCSIPLDDNFASQLHARVFMVDHHPYVEDLDSTNGTLVNGQSISTQVPLNKGDRIAIGGAVLEVQ